MLGFAADQSSDLFSKHVAPLIVVILCGGTYFRDLLVSAFSGVVLRLRGVSVDGIVSGGA